MLIMGYPQFNTQDDTGAGRGIPPIPEWQLDPATLRDSSPLGNLDVDGDLKDTVIRLRGVFQRAQRIPLTSTRLHDLTCFVIHRLLLSKPDTPTSELLALSEAIRYGIILYMFIIQGPTYFSHAVIFNQILRRFIEHLKQLESIHHTHDLIDVWFLAVGMVAATGTPQYAWFMEKARAIAALYYLNSWHDAFARIKSVMWLETQQGESIFRPHWDAALHGSSHPEPPDLSVCVSPSSASPGFI